MGSSFNSLSALYFILYDLFHDRLFVATDAMIVKFQNVDKTMYSINEYDTIELFDCHSNHAWSYNTKALIHGVLILSLVL